MKENKKMKVIKNLKKLSIAGGVAISILAQGGTVFAADDPLSVINNLSTFMFGIIRTWGIVQIGLALKSHDASQRANGFLTLAGGVIITFAKEILDLITGG